MHHPERWTFDWFYKRHDMEKADNRVYRQTETERRAAELHEGCRMPMEQARELAVSEASPDWYACGQDWGLADALTAGQDGDWTLDDIARAFAAGAQAGAVVERQPLRRLWPLIERSMKGYVFTGDKAGEVAADMAALRKALES